MWLRSIEIVRLNGLFDVGPQFRPGVALSENALCQALRAETTVAFLGDFENDFVHASM